MLGGALDFIGIAGVPDDWQQWGEWLEGLDGNNTARWIFVVVGTLAIALTSDKASQFAKMLFSKLRSWNWRLLQVQRKSESESRDLSNPKKRIATIKDGEIAEFKGRNKALVSDNESLQKELQSRQDAVEELELELGELKISHSRDKLKQYTGYSVAIRFLGSQRKNADFLEKELSQIGWKIADFKEVSEAEPGPQEPVWIRHNNRGAARAVCDFVFYRLGLPSWAGSRESTISNNEVRVLMKPQS